MFGIGGTELILLIIIVAVLLGPDQIPQVVKGVSKFMREVTKARDDLKETVHSDETLRSLKSSVDEVKSEIKSRVDSVTSGIQSDINALKDHVEGQIDEKTEPGSGEKKS